MISRLSLPPVTKVLLGSSVFLSTTVFLLRYYGYLLALKQFNVHPPQNIDGTSILAPTFSDLYVPYLTIIAGNKFQFYPWILVTSSLVEEGLISFLLTLTILLYGGRYCEHIWGSYEFGRFILVQCIVPDAIALLFYSFIVHSASTITVCGGSGLICGFLVAFKQLVPEHTIILFRGRIKFRVRHLPILYLSVSTLLSIISSTHGLSLVLSWIGFFSSWVYLRFFRVIYVDPLLPFNNAADNLANTTNSSSGNVSYEHNNPMGIKIIGDASDVFSLGNFFPEPLSMLVERISDRVYNLFVSLKLIKPFSSYEIEAANIRAAARINHSATIGYHSNNDNNINRNSGVGRTARQEAERRRALALRALEQNADRMVSRPGPAVLPSP